MGAVGLGGRSSSSKPARRPRLPTAALPIAPSYARLAIARQPWSMREGRLFGDAAVLLGAL
jgi:hypothetical protein